MVFFDALRVKIREDNVVRNKAVYLALGVRRDGTREVLGLWIETTEGAKFWMKVFNDLKTRGVNDILGAATPPLGCSRTDRGHRRAERDAGGTGSGIPADDAANLRRPPDPQQSGLRQLEGPQTARRGLASDLCRGECRSGGSGVGCVRGGRMGAQVPHGRCSLAAGVGRR